ncbi:MAG: leucine-rich repeat protein [Clostridia bacterium]|nr:leucine-rich repeat protein [Clostridia bacterium]
MKRQSNRLLSALLTLALLLGLFAPGLTVYAGVVDSGDCDTDLTWSLDDAGVLTIAPKDAASPAAMKDFSSASDAPWYPHFSDIKSLVVKKGVTSIGARAFDCAGALETISLPKGLVSIGDCAFYACEMLKKAELPEGLTELGELAFKGCTTLAKVTFSKGVKTIGEETFSGCEALETLTLPENLEVIGKEAFRDCEKLRKADLPATMTTIGENAFRDAALENVEIPASVKEILPCAFLSAELRSITVADGNEYFKSEDGVLYSKDGKTLVQFPAKKNGDYATDCAIPDGVEEIGDYAFAYAKKLTDVSVPATVKTFGSGAFLECEALERFVFRDAEHSTLTTLGYNCFDGCKDLFLALPDSVAEISAYCFRGCDSLTAFAVPPHVTAIRENVFDGCKNMTKIVIPGGVTTVEVSAFADCDALADVYFLGDTTAADALKAGASVGNGKLTGATWHCITDNILATGTVTDSDVKWTVYASGLLEVEPDGPKTEIPDNQCPWNAWSFAITSMTVASGITSIGNNAFRHLSNLGGTVTLPDTVAHLGKEAFAHCRSLENILLPAALTEIPEGCFLECNSLKTIDIPGGVKSIGELAFRGCYSLTSATLHEGLESIGDMAFIACRSLGGILLPEGLKKIGNGAFNMCESFTTVTLPKSLTEIGENVFSQANGLTEILVAEGSENFASENGVLFSADKTTLICYPEGKTGASYTVPESVKAFAPDAIHHNQNLTEIILPELLGELSYCAIQRCPIENLVIPDNVLKICEGSAADFGLDAENRKTLKTVYLPASLTEVGENAFAYNDNLTAVYYGGTEEQWAALKPSIDPVGNEPLLNAIIHYGAKARYTVTYDTNDGSGAPEAQSALYYQQIKLSETTPERSVTVTLDPIDGEVDPATIKLDAAFVNWNTDKDGAGEAYAPGAEYTKGEDVTLYANWDLPKAGDLPTPTRKGSAFDGWFTDPLNGYAVSPDLVLHFDLTLYAHWSEIPKHTLSFDANGGEGAPEAIVKTDGEMIVLPDTIPTRSVTVTLDPCGGTVDPASVTLDAEFTSWNTDPDGGATTYLPSSEFDVNDDITLYAQWELPMAGALPVPSRDGYTFDGWYNDPDGTHEIAEDTVLHFDLTVYAVWGPVEDETTEPVETTSEVTPVETTSEVTPPVETTSEVTPPVETTSEVTPGEVTTNPDEVTTAPEEGTTEPADQPGKTYKLGNVNKDGKVNAKDARAALRISARLDPADTLTLELADANRNGKVQAGDARLILRHSAKIELLPDLDIAAK